MAAWTIDEEFAREHARALRDLASKALLHEMTGEPAPTCDEITTLVVEFERAVHLIAERSREWRVFNHDRLTREAKPPSLRGAVERLCQRFDAWLDADWSDLDAKAREAVEREE